MRKPPVVTVPEAVLGFACGEVERCAPGRAGASSSVIDIASAGFTSVSTADFSFVATDSSITGFFLAIGACLAVTVRCDVLVLCPLVCDAAMPLTFVATMPLCAGVGVRGAFGVSEVGFGVRKFSARLRITCGEALKPVLCPLVG